MTPLEAFFRQKPDLKYIRIFGCICFALFHPSEHAHLSPRAKRGIFYEQSLVEAMYNAITQEVSNNSQVVSLLTSKLDNPFGRKLSHQQFLELDRSNNMCNLYKSPSLHGRHTLMSKKVSLVTRAQAPAMLVHTL